MAEPYNQGLLPLFTTQFTTVLELKLQQMGACCAGGSRASSMSAKWRRPFSS